ncbi:MULTISPECIES: hypothetical protein [unclassified Colwellia]|uniref:hypothetical protein n=1 Tax=unclassified Colwellia TaxID=196834 RepID=UPI0015F35AB8|nr:MULTISPECIES: hypothetical protein [unclassified Colwellia]MBA6380896.1 hypothetical protein [Colwellia sp. BRX10-7]MBA6389003.1 hypothetical protein [Colwellia sp. BRX10-2]MBA6403151.1 hypothetical protein [Colwellia sp. BRX10-5]MBA6407095.1 hypothetical protein [Colwellia sp. BRX10-1]
MNEQTSIWQRDYQSADFAELCNALYERELGQLSIDPLLTASLMQGRLKSLPHYIKRTANSMLQVQTPLKLDVQNATWSAKQGVQMPLNGQDSESVKQWYLSATLHHGLVVPIAKDSTILLDSIDRIDLEQQRFRTNLHGWFSLTELEQNQAIGQLLKPNKKVMTAACSGHCWLNAHRANPLTPSLRELLLSCAINWRNFKQSLAI